MARARMQLAAHLSEAELKARARARKGADPKESRRWQALWLVAQGRSGAQAGAGAGLSASWVRESVRRYNAGGPGALADGHRQRSGGARPLLDATQQTELAAALESPPGPQLGGGQWSGRKVALWIKARTGRTTHPQQGWSYLRRLGFGLRVPRPRHPQSATAAEAAAWKKSCARR